MSTQPSWYRRPAFWIATSVLLLAVAYAVTMKIMLQNKVQEQQQIAQQLQQELKATDEARAARFSMPETVYALGFKIKDLERRMQNNQHYADECRQEVEKLQQDERVKEFQAKEPEMRALLDKHKKIMELLEAKKTEYEKRVREAC